MTLQDEILTVAEVAAELRCSKAHVHNAIRGKVAGVSLLPAISMGRRKLIRRSTLEQWKSANENGPSGGRISESQEIDAAGPMRGEPHA
jgi:excisionase family DNA binding protein